MDENSNDGRVQRRVATRQKLVDAHARLLRSGDVAPAAAVIAQEAGVSLRSLWAVFGDMEALLQASTAHWAEHDHSLHTAIDPGLDLAERVVLFAKERERRLEYIAPAARATAVRLPFSPTLRKSRQRSFRDLTHVVEEVFAAELAAAGDARDLRDRIVTAASWNTWSMYRDDLKYSVRRTRLQLEATVTALLAAAVAGEAASS